MRGYLSAVDADGGRIPLGSSTEREATVEQNVVHEGEGDVVVGDQTNVDRSTTVGDDNVVNRSTIGGAAPDDGGSAAGPSRDTDATTDGRQPTYCTDCGAKLPPDGVCPDCDAGADDTTDTVQYCERHERTYTGGTCPDCRRSTSRSA